eukprot:snap_masked-scaffold_5-processed-gene-3.27-mRNA-1 protein AED:1.00 eAED:1.00 QI:0/0/0/0/1/1/2/0/62
MILNHSDRENLKYKAMKEENWFHRKWEGGKPHAYFSYPKREKMFLLRFFSLKELWGFPHVNL